MVDDDDDMNGALAFVLTLLGAEVDCVFSGEEAIENRCWEGYDIVFLDLRMPRMQGTDVLREINAHDVHPAVVLMTAYAEQRIADQAQEMAHFRYLRKPFSRQAVIDVLDALGESLAD